MDSDRLFSLIIAIPAFVAALTVHEFAHAWMGNRLGDDTARSMGRLTLDPLKHLDPLGSLAFLLGALTGFFFGWAKPVPFNPRNLSHPRRDSMLIAVAGPISNILQVPVWLLLLWGILKIGTVTQVVKTEDLLWVLNPRQPATSPIGLLLQMMSMGIVINFSLAAFNMIPLPPLDGHYVLEGLGPPFVKEFFDVIRPYSFLILIVLINLPAQLDPISAVLRPVYIFSYSLILWTMGFGWQPF